MSLLSRGREAPAQITEGAMIGMIGGQTIFQGSSGSPFGVRFIEDHNLVIKYQFKWPRSKRKRIRQKWEKQEKNFKYKPDMSYYQTGSGAFIGHPAAIAVLKQHIQRR